LCRAWAENKKPRQAGAERGLRAFRGFGPQAAAIVANQSSPKVLRLRSPGFPADRLDMVNDVQMIRAKRNPPKRVSGAGCLGRHGFYTKGLV